MERRTNTRTGREFWASPDDTPRGVRRGEHGTQVVLWKTAQRTETDPDTGERVAKSYPLARMFTVFNAEQAEQLPDRFYPARTGEPLDEIREPQEVLEGYLKHGGPILLHHQASGSKLDAHYNPATDKIVLPYREQFRTPEGYYSTAFHEAGHSTGHRDRLARESLTDFSHDRKWGDAKYAREELVAEMTSAMLQAETGVETDHQFDQSAAYVQSWLGALQGDSKLVPQAAAAAQRAVSMITEPQRQGEPVAEAEAA
jgi:antirestriction protein ArdC